MINVLVKLTENDKRIIIAILLVLILLIVLVGYIGLLITRVMRWQGKKMDEMMHDVVVTKVVDNKRHFLKVARKKNWRRFFKKALVPLLFLIAAFALLFVVESVNNWSYNIFDNEKQGFTTLLFTWNFNDESIYSNFFGIRIISNWPPLANTPHFEWEAIYSYIFAPLFLIGAIWYLIQLQCLISRTIRMYKLSDSIYKKSLDTFNMNEANANNINNNQRDVNTTNNSITK